jgi:hypothetical protein
LSICVLEVKGELVGLTIRPLVVGSGDDQTANSQCEHTRGCLGNCDVEMLLHAIDTAEQETHAHHQQQVGQHTADEGGLHDKGLALDQSDDCDNQLDGVTAEN